MYYVLNTKGAAGINSAPSGIVTVPMTITDGKISEKSAVISGMIGYKLHKEISKPIALEPAHGWALLLEPNSTFRRDLNNWEYKINGIED